ncbi:hypothetical protein Cfor_03837, partial [Coptotermes formosanus]
CLATGESFASLGYCLRVGENTIKTLRESGKAICKILQPICMAVPTSEKWLRIADELNGICKMPNCIGSTDGKHCRIRTLEPRGDLIAVPYRGWSYPKG